MIISRSVKRNNDNGIELPLSFAEIYHALLHIQSDSEIYLVKISIIRSSEVPIFVMGLAHETISIVIGKFVLLEARSRQ